MDQWYQWTKFLHVLSVFVFLLAHGASTAMVFWLRRETKAERIRPVLDLSITATSITGNVSFLMILITGIAATFMLEGGWSFGWVWTALVLAIGISVAMFFVGTRYYHLVRKAVGLPFMENGKEHPPVEPASEAEIAKLVSANTPMAVLVLTGGGGLVVILWLMMFKPF